MTVQKPTAIIIRITTEKLLVDAESTPNGLREYILSVELVTGAGERVRFGSRSVKDVAGYEVIGLLLGSGGRYGMITEATLRLIPKKAAGATGTGKPAAEMRQEDDDLGRIEADIRKVFDPAGILRW